MSIEQKSHDRPLELLAKMQTRAVEQFEVELGEFRMSMLAMASCCEQALTRLRDAGWVPFDSAAKLMTELSAAADLEHTRATRLAQEIDVAKRELADVRAECNAEIEAAREAARRYQEETTASCARDLNAARELALAAMQAEAKAREELTALQARNQEIVDAQMLRLVELKRELEQASTEADRSRAAAETANKEAVAKLTRRPAPAAQQIVLQSDRNHLTPEFSQIEAALKDTPPLPAWERTA
jgi:hypothetical protein